MEHLSSWLTEQFLTPSITQTIIALSLVCVIGLWLGKYKIGNITLGITFVFFVGILASHFGLRTDPMMLSFAQSFGLVIFVYALGLEVGPSFFPSLKHGGVMYNLLSIGMVFVTLLLCWGLYLLFDISMPNLLGVMSGAVTNTPVLAALQDTMTQMGLGDPQTLADMALACAVSYPLGVVGVILALAVLGVMARKSKGLKKSVQSDVSKATYIAEYEVTNPALSGVEVKQAVHIADRHFVISRIWHENEAVIPRYNSVIREGDRLLVISSNEDVELLSALFGRQVKEHDWNKPGINWDSLGDNLVSRRIIITKPKFNGVKLGALSLRNDYAVNITRIDRAGVQLLPNPSLYLQLGDRITVVGDGAAVEQVSDLLGDKIELLDKPKLTSFFGGILLGCLLGMVPFYIPSMSMPVKLGLAGGPIIVGILMGAFGPRLHLTTYITNSATQLVKQLGIVIYMAGLGLASGAKFFETIMHGDGLLWVAIGFIITMVPTIIVGILSMKIFKIDLGSVAGTICGSMANPMALDYADSLVKGDEPSVVYATVYPLGMFIRIITAQILLLFFI